MRKLVLLPLVMPLTAMAATSFDGCYSKVEKITIRYEQPETIATVVNHLGIKKISESTYAFSLFLTGDNHHLCTAEGKAKLVKTGTAMMLRMIPEATDATEPEEFARCQIGLTLEPSEIRVSEIAGKCGEHFLCGQGMGFSLATFPRKSRQPVPDSVTSCSPTP